METETTFYQIKRTTLLKTLVAAFIAALLLWGALLIHIQYPATPNFDEFHYIPSAKQFIALSENQNWEHPPLAKELMAISISIAGDTPLGWRLGSTFFGALTVIGFFFWALSLFRDLKSALFASALLGVNQIVYVQSRIGMLDSYMMAFWIWGLAALTELIRTQSAPLYLLDAPRLRPVFSTTTLWIFYGSCMGLAVACKWTSVVGWISSLALYLFFFLRKLSFAARASKLPQNFKKKASKKTSNEVNWGLLFFQLIAFGIVLPIILYSATFLPFLWVKHTPAYTLLDLWQMQYKMFDGQLRVIGKHPYHSAWWGWPLMLKPIWFAFDKEGEAKEFVRGVLCIGNPAIFWTGLLAVLACGWQSIKEAIVFFKSMPAPQTLSGNAKSLFSPATTGLTQATSSETAFQIFYYYSAFFWCWAIIPRKVSFFYYYYPASFCLPLALVWALNRIERSRPNLELIRWTYLGICVGLFIYFFPILAALKIPAGEYIRWMWFNSWI